MKIAVFGATGGTGIQVVKFALDCSFEVKAFVRDPNKMAISEPKLEVVTGDILDANTVDRAVEGIDGVLLALGSDKPVLSEGTKNIIASMKKHGAKRLIVESSYSFSGSEEGIERLKAQGMTDEQIVAVQPILDDKTAQEKATRESGLEWVIVRPLTLTDGPKTGQYRVGETLDLKLDDSISRVDVADFMLKCLTDNQWLGKTVVVSY